MSKLTITLLIGLAAGTLDVLPMVLGEGEWIGIASAYAHWLVTAVLISYTAMLLPPWLRGALIGALNAVPVLITYSHAKPSSVLPVLGSSIMLGGAVGFTTARLAA
jgi:hypothetical protein